MIAVDLFSGCGGVTEGLRQAGFTVAAAVEIDDWAAETYAQNHPSVRLWNEDILNVNPREVRRALSLARGDLALLAACAPCQGFSRLRTLNGAETIPDPRNDLVLRVLPFVEELLPHTLMLENVPGAQHSAQMLHVQERLRQRGYSFEEAVLDVADYGVPQRRRRHILIGARARAPEFPEIVARRVTVREAIAHLPSPGKSGDPVHDVTAKWSPRIKSLIARIPRDGGSRSSLPRSSQLNCHLTCDGFSDVYGRMRWDTQSPTITSGFVNPSKGRFLHPTEDRAITPREAALLQGFPCSYYFSMRRGKYAVAVLIGNAVPPEFARRQALALRAVMSNCPTVARTATPR